jgi:K+-transporting ATPase A subunit
MTSQSITLLAVYLAALLVQAWPMGAFLAKVGDGSRIRGWGWMAGIAASTLFAAITTAASCGAVNAMHDSFMPLGGLVPTTLIQFGEVVFGGVGSGLYGMLIFAILAVAGSLAAKKRLDVTAGTMPTHGPLFIALLVGVVVLVGVLNYVPALALGPVVEHLQLFAH